MGWARVCCASVDAEVRAHVLPAECAQLGGLAATDWLALSTEPPSRLKVHIRQTYLLYLKFYLLHLFFPPWLAEYEKTSFLAPQPAPLGALSLLL